MRAALWERALAFWVNSRSRCHRATVPTGGSRTGSLKVNSFLFEGSFLSLAGISTLASAPSVKQDSNLGRIISGFLGFGRFPGQTSLPQLSHF